MCTLTWHDAPDGYQVFFNRDERRERGPEEPPAVRRRGSTTLIAPLDSDFGGSWIAVNPFGLGACLLNGLPETAGPAAEPPGGYLSRGTLPLEAVEARTSEAVARWLGARDLTRFRPFVLIAFEPGRAGLRASWSGRRLEIATGRPATQPVVSSSLWGAKFSQEVRGSRAAVWAELKHRASASDPAAAHLEFHASHLPERGPHSPCMHRDDASTVSFSRIEVDAREIRFHYAPNSPCEGLPAAAAVSIARARPMAEP